MQVIDKVGMQREIDRLINYVNSLLYNVGSSRSGGFGYWEHLLRKNLWQRVPYLYELFLGSMSRRCSICLRCDLLEERLSPQA